MIANAIATAMLCAVALGEVRRQERRAPARTATASAGSPIQPRPRLAIVMPSCVAAM